MNTMESSRERISALTDGELEGAQAELALAALHSPEARAQWDIYHRVGDMLRSSDMASDMSAGFAARMAAALEREPAIVAPAPASAGRHDGKHDPKHAKRRWLLPGMAAAAAAAAVAFVTTPHLLMTEQNQPAMPAIASGATATQVAAVPVVPAAGPEGVVLRDARIDDYLLAHQRFSPSVFSAAQYARSATFATDPAKK
jgi:sigma-E factor negative regulatory protein RseA